MKNKVSIWLGKFDSDQELSQYLEFKYFNELYDLPISIFTKEFKIDYYDQDFQDAYCSEKIIISSFDLIQPLSYSKTFIEQVPNNISDNNSVIALYDFKYDQCVKNSGNVYFLGVFDYKI